MTIREPETGDAEALSTVLTCSIRELCTADHGNDERLIAQWCTNKTPAKLRKWIESGDALWRVAEEDGKILGVSAISVSGEILLCYLLPEYTGRGIGAALLNELIRQAQAFGLRKVRLISTRTARAFYKSQGFIETGETLAHGIRGYEMEKDVFGTYA